MAEIKTRMPQSYLLHHNLLLLLSSLVRAVIIGRMSECGDFDIADDQIDMNFGHVDLRYPWGSCIHTFEYYPDSVKCVRPR